MEEVQTYLITNVHFREYDALCAENENEIKLQRRFWRHNPLITAPTYNGLFCHFNFTSFSFPFSTTSLSVTLKNLVDDYQSSFYPLSNKNADK